MKIFLLNCLVDGCEPDYWLPVYPYNHSSIHLFLQLSKYLSLHPSINSFFHPSIHSSIHPSIHQLIHSFILPSIHPFINLFFHLSIHPSIHPPTCQGQAANAASLPLTTYRPKLPPPLHLVPHSEQMDG